MAKLPLLIEALLYPRAYPHNPQKIELAQTQMSFLFLTGGYVYKVKKPVDLGYLDYTTLEKRNFFCHQELKLNKRLCPEVYLAVVPITEEKGQFWVEGEGRAVEYAVKMLQLPQERMMDFLLSANRLTSEMVIKVAQKLADFHQKAETNPKISTFGNLSAITQNADENFTQTEKCIDVTISSQKYRYIEAYTESFIREKASLFEKRVKEGRIRDCHGDLHAAHICFSDDICIYDCIEFNDRFRYCDIASEVAFLAMDLDRYGRGDLSNDFVRAYVELNQDEELMGLLNFYKCYRAYVRGKVESFKLDDVYISEQEKGKTLAVARSYFDLAYRYTHSKLRLFMTTGLVGTGKTTVAQALGKRLGLVVISSDIVRKRLAGIPVTEHRFEEYRGGIYAEDFSRRTYDEMFAEAEKFLSQGQSVILDASFKKREYRLQAKALAGEMGAEFFVIECVLNEKTVKERLELRLKEETTSDGRWEIFGLQKQEFDKVVEFPSESRIIVDTSEPVDKVVELILKKVA